MTRLRLPTLAMFILCIQYAFQGCSAPPAGNPTNNNSGPPTPPGMGDGPPTVGGEDFVTVDEETTLEERKYLSAGKPFIVALSAGRYDDAYRMLSSHAKRSLSPDQFLTPTDDAAQATPPIENISARQFAEQMKQVVKRYGPPHSPQQLYVESSDPAVLAGGGDALERMFAIGNMPQSIPAAIRRASLRGSVRTKLSADEIKRIAEEYDMTVAEVESSDEQPYYNIKFVLVDDEGALKVGYFEIMPPSMLD